MVGAYLPVDMTKSQVPRTQSRVSPLGMLVFVFWEGAYGSTCKTWDLR